MYLEDRIKIEEKRFIEVNGRAPSYLALSVYGYAELIRELAEKSGKTSHEWEQDLNYYHGLHVLVSQDASFHEFILL